MLVEDLLAKVLDPNLENKQSGSFRTADKIAHVNVPWQSGSKILPSSIKDFVIWR